MVGVDVVYAGEVVLASLSHAERAQENRGCILSRAACAVVSLRGMHEATDQKRGKRWKGFRRRVDEVGRAAGAVVAVANG